MKKKLSIHDIARQLKVSPTAISFVLNGKAEEKRISYQLEQRVLRHVAEVGYQPNMIAKSLRTGKSNLIGMLVEDISDPFFSEIARYVEAKAYRLGYKIFYSSTENNAEKARALIRVYKDRQVDGYIIAPPSGIEPDIQSLLDENCPVILFDRFLPGLNTTNVVIDNFQGAYEATLHLIKNGYRNIGLVTLESGQTQMVGRLKGYNRAMQESGRPAVVHQLPFGRSQMNMTGEIRQFLLENNHLDAVLFGTNYLVVSALRAVAKLSLRIPDDLAVISFDDHKHFGLLSTPITAVAQPVQCLAEEVVRLLSIGLSANELKAETIVLPTKLVVRRSSHPIKNRNLYSPE